MYLLEPEHHGGRVEGDGVKKKGIALSAIVDMSRAPSVSIAVYKSKTFARFAKKASITDVDLWKAALLANDGVIDADLGGGVIKQRIARSGEGKSGGSRTILAFRKEDRAVYIFGFEKKDLDNIDATQLKTLRTLAKVILGYNADEMKQQIKSGELSFVAAPKESENG